MSSTTQNILSDRDINAPVNTQTAAPGTEAKGEVKSMEYHRQVLQSKLDGEKSQETYISPSDTIMSPCTAKLSAYRGQMISKNVKPKSLFAKTSSKNLAMAGGPMFGDKVSSSKTSPPLEPTAAPEDVEMS